MKSIKLLFIFPLLMFVISLNGQQILSNPSFEIMDSGDNAFAGWNQIGEVDTSQTAWHGNLAAKASGITSGEWNVSGVWQNLDCAVGEQWEIAGNVKNSLNAPLSGNSIAIVNIEWYNASNQQIDFQSFTVADNATSADEYNQFNMLSSPSPAGTSSTHLLIGIVQSPDEPAAEVIFDQITFYSTTSPTIDEVQWMDFPDGRTMEFADYVWRVKGTGWYGPGPNNFSHTQECVWIDEFERLHLTIKNIDNVWYSTEVVLSDALGYGDYVFTTCGDLDQLDIHTVLGLFIWQYSTYYGGEINWWNPYNEIDVEFSYWANPGNEIGQFVAQPWDWEGNLIRFDAEFENDELTSHAFNWQPDIVEFRSWYGGVEDESPENMIFQWTYTGVHIPRPEQPRVHINLWQFAGSPATQQEVIIDDFNFVSTSTTSETDYLVEFAGRLINYPNPFNPQTTIEYQMIKPGTVKLEVYNIKGQKVKSLLDEHKDEGTHTLVWNAQEQPSGIYCIRLTTSNQSQTRKIIMLK